MRTAINQLWNSSLSHVDRSAKVRQLMDEHRVSAATPRDDDVTLALGESYQRMVLMLAPIGEDATNAEYIRRALDCAGKNDIQIPVRMVQHLFARCASYTEAISMFHTMRECRVAMGMDAYYAMVFCLQRLEEESWATRHREEVKASSGRVTPQTVEFILHGCENQLLSESKPWLGRVMFADAEAGQQRSQNKDFDAMGSAWTSRYKSGHPLPKAF